MIPGRDVTDLQAALKVRYQERAAVIPEQGGLRVEAREAGAVPGQAVYEIEPRQSQVLRRKVSLVLELLLGDPPDD